MKIFITGIGGFVGQHLSEICLERAFSVSGIAKDSRPNAILCDINDTARLADLLSEIQPNFIIHLAAVSNVASSFETERLTHEINYMGTHSLLQAAWKKAPTARILFVSSGQVYESSDKPISESHILEPLSPYASSKLAAEILCAEYVKTKKMQIVVARSFNHIGKGQEDSFFVPSTLKQIRAALSAGARKLTLNVGNLSAIRDFLCVEDVCNAYLLLLEEGKTGEVYNVASGQGYSIEEIIEIFATVSGLEITIHQEQSRIRAVEKPCLIGDSGKLRALGWQPSESFQEIIKRLIHNR